MGTELVAAGSVSDMMALAETLCKSSLVPEAVRGKPQDALVILLTGRELGLGAMQALRGINVIKGKASMSADLMIGLVKRSPECEWFRLVASTDTEATYETKRRGEPEPTSLTYTFAMATKAGLTGNQTYKAHPAAMLRARGGAALARAVYPDLCMGLYELSEAEEMQTREPANVAPAPRNDLGVMRVGSPVALPPAVLAKSNVGMIPLQDEPEPEPGTPQALARAYVADMKADEAAPKPKRRANKPVSQGAHEFVEGIQPETPQAPPVEAEPDPETMTPAQRVAALRSEMEFFFDDPDKAELVMKEFGMFTDPSTGDTREPRDWDHLITAPKWLAKIRRQFEAAKDMKIGAAHE